MPGNDANGGARKTRAAIVTGGASGIGLAMSQHFAAQGYNVAVFDVNVKMGNEVAANIASQNPHVKVVFRTCDVSSWQSQAERFKEVYDEFGSIDVVCANAGISEKGSSALASIEDGEAKEPDLKMMDVNLSGVIYCEFPEAHKHSAGY